MKLVLHTIFTLNYDFVDEEFAEEHKKRVRDLLCATSESLAVATKSELEVESKLKADDSTPVDSPVAAHLEDAAAQAHDAGVAGNGGGAAEVWSPSSLRSVMPRLPIAVDGAFSRWLRFRYGWTFRGRFGETGRAFF